MELAVFLSFVYAICIRSACERSVTSNTMCNDEAEDYRQVHRKKKKMSSWRQFESHRSFKSTFSFLKLINQLSVPLKKTQIFQRASSHTECCRLPACAVHDVCVTEMELHHWEQTEGLLVVNALQTVKVTFKIICHWQQRQRIIKRQKLHLWTSHIGTYTKIYDKIY